MSLKNTTASILKSLVSSLNLCASNKVTQITMQFVIFNPWKGLWNWIAFSQTSFVISPYYSRHWTTCKWGFYVKSHCFLETIAYQFKNCELSFGSDQDKAEIQYDRLSTLKWHNCEKCEKMSTSLERMCCHKILAVKFFAVDFNFIGNHFLEESFSEIS